MIGLDPIVVGSYEACRTARRPTLTGVEEVGAREPFTFGRHLHLAGRVVVSSKVFCRHFFLIFEHHEVI